jgi:hypothetical protein
MRRKEQMSLEDALIDLYLNVKVRKQDDVRIILTISFR